MNAFTDIFSSFVHFFSTLPSYVKTFMLITMVIYLISSVMPTLLNALKKDIYIEPMLKDKEVVNLEKDEFEIKINIPVNCINCGAVVSDSGICEYCGTDYNKSA